MTVLAAVSAALACWVLLGPRAGARLARPRADRGDQAHARGRWRRLWPVLTVAGAGTVGGLAAEATGATFGVVGALPLVTALLVWRQHRRRSMAAARSVEVSNACQALAGLLRVGHVPSSALRIAARDAPLLAEAVAMLDIGSAVPPVLRRLGRGPGGHGLRELATAWEVAERTGASLTATLDALDERLTARRKLDDVIAAELSAPRATGRLLAVLPLAGILLGYAFGGDPLAFLTGSLPGRLALVAGVGLGCAGVLWTERIADRGGM